MQSTQQHVPSRASRRSLRQALNLRTLKYGSHASLFTIMVLAVTVILYAMAVAHNQRFDVTRSKRFTLADQSVKLLQNLTHPIKVVGFFRLEDRGRVQFEELLKQYTYHTDSLTYELVDPDRHPALAKRYSVTAYNTVVIAANDKEEKIFRLEEDALTNAILKVTQETKKVMYFITGHGEPSTTESERTGYNLARQGLEDQNYIVKELLLARHEQIPDDAAVVVVAGPRKDLLDAEFQALGAYLARGGHLLFMLDPDVAPSLGSFLKPYGIELANDMVVEPNALGRLFGGDYLMPAVTAYEEHPITRDFGRVMTIYPVVRSVSIAKELPEGVSAQALASTSPQSWAETDLKTLQEGRSAFDEDSDRKGPISIAVVATIPSGKQHDGTVATTDEAGQGNGNASHPARLVVFGDSEFANNNFFTLQGNGDIFLNTVSWLAEEEELIAIRPREGGGSGPIVLTAAQQPLIFWVPVVLLPLVVFASGIIVFVRRRWQQ